MIMNALFIVTALNSHNNARCFIIFIQPLSIWSFLTCKEGTPSIKQTSYAETEPNRWSEHCCFYISFFACGSGTKEVALCCVGLGCATTTLHVCLSHSDWQRGLCPPIHHHHLCPGSTGSVCRMHLPLGATATVCLSLPDISRSQDVRG